MHPHHTRTVSDLLLQAAETPDQFHVESGLMDGVPALVLVAHGEQNVALVQQWLKRTCDPKAHDILEVVRDE